MAEKNTKLYQADVYMKEWDARVIQTIPVGSDGSSIQVILDRTAFFPEGGGQSCDTGFMNGFRVVDVQEAGEAIVHTLTADATGDSGSDASPDFLKIGDTVHCTLDWDRRFDNMQRHCGEHILSGIFYARCGGVNRGFHMGADYMTIDISLEEDPTDPDTPRPEAIDMDLALECEARANQVVWSDAPVTVFRFDERDQVSGLPLRKALAFDEDISIVCVGSPENASDCVACCGTHPASAGQVGLIKIYKVENYKGMFRIYFEAGARALSDYDRKHDLLSALANDHSSSIDDLPDVIRAQENQIAELKNELHQLKASLIDRECAALDSLLADCSEPLLRYSLRDFSLDDVFTLAKRYMGKPGPLLLLYAPKQTSYILVSGGEPKCGALVREYASFYKGKGGGNDVSARSIFTSEEDALLFADLLAKHLK